METTLRINSRGEFQPSIIAGDPPRPETLRKRERKLGIERERAATQQNRPTEQRIERPEQHKLESVGTQVSDTCSVSNTSLPEFPTHTPAHLLRAGQIP